LIECLCYISGNLGQLEKVWIPIGVGMTR
jgi:hypothetical protein